MVDLDRVAALLDKGKTTAEIAQELRTTTRTINRARAALGRSGDVGRPETGEREQVSFRADDDVLAELDKQAAEEGTTRGGVAGDVVAAWARRRRDARRR